MKDTDHLRLMITAGDGPAECQHAVVNIAQRMEEEALLHGVSLSMHRNDSKHGARSVIVLVHGASRQAFTNRWLGTIQWVMQSQIRLTHKRRNWFVGVFALDASKGAGTTIQSSDVKLSTLRAGGPGGQHQNTTDSAVRATHTPTGLTVVVRDGRSQHRNKALAMMRLQELTDARATADKEDRKSRQNRLHHTLERGNPVRRFTGASFQEET